MTRPPAPPRIACPAWRELAGYLVAVVLALVLAGVALRLDRADLGHPLTRGGDTLYSYVIGKTLVERGLSPVQPALGLPGEMRLIDATLFHNWLHVGGLRLLAVPCPDGWRLINLYYLLSYPLIVLTTLLVFRHFGVSWSASLVCALLFTLQPYHLQRSTRHLFLAAYFMVPLAVMAVLWALEGLHGRRLAAAAVICAVLPTGGVYYAFFTAFFMLVAATALALRRRPLRQVAAPLVLALLIAVTAAACAWPAWRAHPDGSLSAVAAGDAVKYGLRPLRLFLPTAGHVVPGFAAVSAGYDEAVPFEVRTSALGVVAAAGLVLLLAWPAVARSSMVVDERRRALLAWLALLAASGLLLATRGALGALLAQTVLPLIRSYARMSIFLAFFALFAVALVLDGLPRTWRWLLPAVLVVGLLDQVGTAAPAAYPVIDAEFARDRAIVQRIEETLPPRAVVFQLPVMAFPQGGDIVQCLDYDPSRGYLHGAALRWSYGAARGREAELWQRHLEQLPADEMVASMCAAGFGGVWVDRAGYPDQGVSLEDALSACLAGRPPLRSDDGRFLFFELGPTAEALARTPAWTARREALLHPVLLSWGRGFHGLEGNAGRAWRWCEAEGILILDNSSTRPRRVQVHMVLTTPAAASVSVDGRTFPSSSAGVTCDLELELPPGRRILRFACDGPRVEAPADRRVLYFSVSDFRMASSPP